MNISRRDLGKMAFAALPAMGLPVDSLLAKPNSKFGGVQIGINAPYSFHNMPGGADDVIKYLTQLNLSSVELRTQPVEGFLGAPVVPAAPGRNKPPLTSDEQAARKAAIEDLRKWRLALSVDRIKEFRKKYESAGILIEIVKVDGIDAMEDDVVDYAFVMAKTLGAHALSCEIPVSRTKRLGEFATRHKLMVGYHGHANMANPEAFAKPESWETAMSYSKYNGINLDLGHFTAGNNTSPVDFIKKHHDRITHVHLKDRKLNNGPNVPWGQGDTPVKEVLQLMQKEKYPFQGTIEFEYPVPKDSDLMTELAKCVQYCKSALV
jgi:sugar phosphate isomerase/epimerase